MVYEDFLSRFTRMSRDTLGDNLIGVYLHGSAAMGCFNPAKSDLDLLLVVESDITDTVKRTFLEHVTVFQEEGPAKGIELSIVKKAVCNPFIYPTPFELHFSPMHLNWFLEKPEDYIEKMRGTDRDLAAHAVIVRHCGKVLWGEPIEAVFGQVRKEDYLDSIWRDIKNAREEILENPMYLTLNLCRVLAYAEKDLILSKRSGGEWGLLMLPEKFRPLIQEALRSYVTEEHMTPDSRLALEFADYMLPEIERSKSEISGTGYLATK